MADAAEKPDAAGLMLVDHATGKSYTLFDGFRIGRVEGDLVLGHDGSVSSKHCVFHLSGKALEVEDVGSRNGTLVGSDKIAPQTRVALLPGAKVTVGDTVFVVQNFGEKPKKRETAIELASLFSQLAPDSIPARMPNEWSSAVKPQEVRLPPPERQEKPRPIVPKPGSAIPPAKLAWNKTAGAAKNYITAPIYVFVALNALAFAWAVSSGADLFDPTVESLVAAGGNINGLTTGGQWWRLLTATFAHGGVIHLLSNMLALYFLGIPVARNLGPARFCSMYFTAGLLGGLASIAFNPANIVTVGASGSVFGVYGGLLALQIRKEVSVRAIGGFGMITTLNFIARNIGLGMEGIDVAAHLGGLVVGTLLTLYYSAGGSSIKRTWLASSVAAAVIVAFAAFVPEKETPLFSVPPFMKKIAQISGGLTKLTKDYGEAYQAMETSKLSEDAFLQKVRDSFIPTGQKIIAELEAVPAARPEEQELKRVQIEIVRLLLQQFSELLAYVNSSNQAHLQNINVLKQKIEAANAELDKSKVKVLDQAISAQAAGK